MQHLWTATVSSHTIYSNQKAEIFITVTPVDRRITIKNYISTVYSYHKITNDSDPSFTSVG